MRTTLELDDSLVREAKRRAAEEGSSLTRIIETALRLYLAPQPRPGKRFRLKLLTMRGRLLPGVNLEDRDALYEVMEGRR